MQRPPRPGLGYFASPPSAGSSRAEQEKNREADEKAKQEAIEREKEEEEKRELERKEREKREQDKIAERRAKEQAEALRGEEEWVRSGMTLYDENGERDVARTAAIREDLRVRDMEDALRTRWRTYEERWRDLLLSHSQEKLSFQDIPWPVEARVIVVGKYLERKKVIQPIELTDLTPARIEDFLLGDLSVRGSTVTRKSRLRSSLLRWHPDKLPAGLLERIGEEDVDKVKLGMGEVIRCIQGLNETRQ